MPENEYIYCPDCGSNVAVLEDNYQFGKIGHCIHDCGYKWYMLIEPDPNTFNNPHPLHSHIKEYSKSIYGYDSEIVPFEDDLEELYYEDKERYSRILECSNLNQTNFNDNNSNLIGNRIYIQRKRQKFFERYALNQKKDQIKRDKNIIKDFLNNRDSLMNFIYICTMNCSMETHINIQLEQKRVENNRNIEEGFEELQDDEKKISAITYNEYSKNEFLKYCLDDINSEEFLTTVKNYLNETYGISFLYIKSEYDKNNGCRPLTVKQEEIVESMNYNPISLEKLTEQKKSEIKTDTDIVPEKLIEFYKQETTYNKTVLELLSLIKEDSPIAFQSMKPYIITLEDFYKDIKSNMNIPSLIDYDNNIVFMSISHKALLNTLHKINIDNYLNNTMSNISDSKCISYHEYKEASELDEEKLEIYFHNNSNTVQVFTSLINEKAPKMLTYKTENKEIHKLIDILNNNNINFDRLTNLNDISFKTLNGTGKISGEIYFPKPEEEDIPQGKILVIPTASEEYFLPAISQMEGSGCIITEKGSQTSHLIINSKEFNFNIILVKDAMKLFNQDDYISLDLDNEEVIKE